MSNTIGAKRVTRPHFLAVRRAQRKGIPVIAIRSQYGYSTTTQNRIRASKTWPEFERRKAAYAAKQAASKKLGVTCTDNVVMMPVTDSQYLAKAFAALSETVANHDLAIQHMQTRLDKEETRLNRVITWLTAVDKRASKRWWHRGDK